MTESTEAAADASAGGESIPRELLRILRRAPRPHAREARAPRGEPPGGPLAVIGLAVSNPEQAREWLGPAAAVAGLTLVLALAAVTRR